MVEKTLITSNRASLDIEEIRLLDIPVHPITVAKLHEFIECHIDSREKALILHVNVHCVNLATKNHWLKDFLNRADLVFCDGAGIMLGARIMGYHIPQRITYADWIWQLGEFAASRDYSLFFLGARPGIAARAAVHIRRRFPKIRIVGTHHGYFNKMKGHPRNRAVLTAINSAAPDILLVGFGMPLQEKWLQENWKGINATIALTGGAVFDYTSGTLSRGPTWMTNNGFEWLARLIIEPRRLWKRYLIGNPSFLYRILKERIKRGFD